MNVPKYRWRIPYLKAVQYDGKNNKEIKLLIGDESESEEPTVGTGKFEEPSKEEREKEKHASAGHDKGHGQVTTLNMKGAAGEAPEPPKEIREKLKLSKGDWVTVDLVNNKLELNPKDFPDKFDFVP